MSNFLVKISDLCFRIGALQPRPHIGCCKDSALSWRFYKDIPETDLCQRNWFGNLWSDVWWKLGLFTLDLAEDGEGL